ncbi:sensor histidine kinase [Lactococcus sp.]|uniref:sensor histidine kinase n=1 Tax=Lactococcus sp. TaxID=44273 RepID=UPI0035AE310E
MYWRSFLKAKLPQISVFCLILVIYIINFILWDLPLIAFFNCSLLALLVFIIYLLFSYSRWKNAQIKLTDLQKENEDLKQSLDDQSRITQDFTDVIRVWSHQMKVPLSAIDLMAQTQVDENELKNQVFLLENYLKIFLEYQRITNLSTDFKFEKFSVSELSKKIIKKYSHFFIQKGLTIRFEIQNDWFVSTDKRWFELALEQFINNAVKYTKTGGVTIVIEPGRIEIHDTGIGILAEDLPRLFEHGFTGFNGRIQQKSTGLGLYLARLILEKLDFSAQIQSEIDSGTQVSIVKNQ